MKLHEGSDEKIKKIFDGRDVVVSWYKEKGCNMSEAIHCECLKALKKYEYLEGAILYLEKNENIINTFGMNSGISLLGMQQGKKVWYVRAGHPDDIEEFFKKSDWVNKHRLDYDKVGSNDWFDVKKIRELQNKSTKNNQSKPTTEKSTDKSKNVLEKSSNKSSKDNKSSKPEKESKSGFSLFSSKNSSSSSKKSSGKEK